MSKAISTKPPSGMRDFLPGDIVRRRYVIDVIRGTYEAHGFVPLETPSIENLRTLLGKYGDEGDQLLYRLLHRRDALARAVDRAAAEGRPATEGELADQGLRYDLTVPLARVVAQYKELPRFFKRYQIQPVWRADRPGRGRFREFYQCDADIVGTTSPMADVEVCAAAASVLTTLGFDFTIRLNHRELLRALIRAAGIEEAMEGTALVAVDKLDKIGRDGVIAELEERGIDSGTAQRLVQMMVVDGDNPAVLAHLRACDIDEQGRHAVEALAALLDMAADTPAGTHLGLSPDLARGLSYYTGPIFEIAVPDLAGSLGGGGRYDDLVGMFGKRQVPAVGFSLGLERMLVVMEERGLYPEFLRVGPDIMLCWMGVEQRRVLGCATLLRRQGLRVEVFPESAKLGKQLQYADTAGADFAGIIGENELASGQITIKHLPTGTQTEAPIEQAAQVVVSLRDDLRDE